jgi:hypothetical protein
MKSVTDHMVPYCSSGLDKTIYFTHTSIKIEGTTLLVRQLASPCSQWLLCPITAKPDQNKRWRVTITQTLLPMTLRMASLHSHLSSRRSFPWNKAVCARLALRTTQAYDCHVSTFSWITFQYGVRLRNSRYIPDKAVGTKLRSKSDISATQGIKGVAGGADKEACTAYAMNVISQRKCLAASCLSS